MLDCSFIADLWKPLVRSLFNRVQDFLLFEVVEQFSITFLLSFPFSDLISRTYIKMYVVNFPHFCDTCTLFLTFDVTFVSRQRSIRHVSSLMTRDVNAYHVTFVLKKREGVRGKRDEIIVRLIN